MGLDEATYKPSTVYNRISAAKNRLISFTRNTEEPEIMGDDAANMRPKDWEIYKTYALRCFKAGAMDFDDILFNTDKLFREHLDVLNKYQHRIHYIWWMSFRIPTSANILLSGNSRRASKHFCVVGDDAKEISMLSRCRYFRTYWTSRKIILTWRSLSSNRTIAQHKPLLKPPTQSLPRTARRFQKCLDKWRREFSWTHQSGVDNEEGKLIATSIFEEKMQNSLRYSDFVVLYRTNSQNRAIEESLRRMSIKYKVVGGYHSISAKKLKMCWPTCASPSIKTMKPRSNESLICPNAALAILLSIKLS